MDKTSLLFRTLSLLAVLVCGFAGQAAAEESLVKPIAVLSIAPTGQLKSDLDSVSALVGNDRFGELLAQLVERVSGLGPLAGIDASRPMGIVLGTDGLLIAPVAMVPVKNGNQLLQSLEPVIGKPEKRDDGLLTVGRHAASGVAQVKDDWLLVCQSEDGLKYLPGMQQFLGLPPGDDVALCLYPQHTPDALRDFAIDRAQVAVEEARLVNSAGEVDRRLRQAQRDQLAVEQFFHETERILLSFSIDGKDRSAHLRLRIQPTTGSELSRQVARLLDMKSRFSDLSTDDAAVTAGLRLLPAEGLPLALATLLDEVPEVFGRQWTKQIETAPKPQQACLSEALKWFRAAGRGARTTDGLDAKVVLYGEKAPFGMLLGLAVKDGFELEKQLKRTAQSCAGGPFLKKVDYNVHRGGDAVVHTLHLQEEAKGKGWLFGQTSAIHVAFERDCVWSAFGPNSLDKLTAAMDRGSGEVSPISMRLRAGAALPLMAQMQSGTQLAQILNLLAFAAAGRDNELQLALEEDEGELVVHLSADEGLVRLTATALAFVASTQQVP